jgi:hypothetical protein
MVEREFSYTREPSVSSTEDQSERLLDDLESPQRKEDVEFHQDHVTRMTRQISPVWILLAAFLMFLASLGVFMASAATRRQTDIECAVQLSSYCTCITKYSPLFHFIDYSKWILTDLCIIAPALEAIEYEEFNFPNEFDQPSIYRGPPTLELEQAWKDLWFCESSEPLYSLPIYL